MLPVVGAAASHPAAARHSALEPEPSQVPHLALFSGPLVLVNRLVQQVVQQLAQRCWD